MSNIIDSIQLSGVTYGIKGSGGTETIELTQSQYDALVDKDPNVFYIITDAEAGDLTNYYTKTETNTLLGNKADTATTYTKTEVDTALATKQATLQSGTNIKTINNESVLGSGNIDIQGGGSTYTAGRGIDITNDTVSVSLPISAGTGTNSLILGYYSSGDSYWNSKASGEGAIACGVLCTASGKESFAIGYKNTASGGVAQYGNFAQGYMTTASGNRCHSEGLKTSSTADASHSEGNGTTASGNYSHSEGEKVNATNQCEHSQGRYNVSNKANNTWGDSGNTLFSVGNGTADNARHNAFEIRQNGDIYLSLNGQDVKLQDHLGGGGGKAVSGGTNISITTGETADTINCTLPITTAIDNTSLNFGFNTINSEVSYSFGNANTVGRSRYNGSYSMAVGLANIADGGEAQFVTGYNNRLLNVHEFGSGQFNNSVSESTTFGDSGNTLFSVGNGTADNARHNAFEIRQNGDIYCSDGTNDVKLQDTITATAANTTALGGLSLVKLTQAEYDALATKDNSTLYVIVN